MEALPRTCPGCSYHHRTGSISYPMGRNKPLHTQFQASKEFLENSLQTELLTGLLQCKQQSQPFKNCNPKPIVVVYASNLSTEEGSLRQENCCELESSLDYLVSSVPSLDGEPNPVSNNSSD